MRHVLPQLSAHADLFELLHAELALAVTWPGLVPMSARFAVFLLGFS